MSASSRGALTWLAMPMVAWAAVSVVRAVLSASLARASGGESGSASDSCDSSSGDSDGSVLRLTRTTGAPGRGRKAQASVGVGQ